MDTSNPGWNQVLYPKKELFGDELRVKSICQGKAGGGAPVYGHIYNTKVLWLLLNHRWLVKTEVDITRNDVNWESGMEGDGDVQKAAKGLLPTLNGINHRERQWL